MHAPRKARNYDKGIVTIIRQIISLIWFLIAWSLFVVVACAIVGGFYVFNQADETIRAKAEELLARQYPNLKVSVRSARLLELEGFEIGGISFSLPGESQPIPVATVDEIMVRCNPRLEELMNGQIDVRKVIARRVVITAARFPDGRWNIEELLRSPPSGDFPMPVVELQNCSFIVADLATHDRRVYTLRDINATLAPEVADVPNEPGRQEMRVQLRDASLSGDHLRRTRLNGWFSPERKAWEVWSADVQFDISPSLGKSLPVEFTQIANDIGDLTARINTRFHATYNPTQSNQIQYYVEGKLVDGRWHDARLPYPLSDITASFQANQEQVAIHDIRAMLGTAAIALNLHRDDTKDNEPITAVGKVTGLNVNRQLISGMPLEIQQQWQKFQPTGEMDATFHIQIVDGQWIPEFDITLRDVALQWDAFPYPLTQTNGLLHVRPGSVVTSDKPGEQLVGLGSGGTPIRIKCSLKNPGKNWYGWSELQTAQPLPIDEALIAAGSPQMQSVLRPFNASGRLMYSGRFERKSAQHEVYKQAEVQLVNCSIRHEAFPYPMHQMQGRLILTGDDWRFINVKGTNDSAKINCQGTWDDDRQGGFLALTFDATDVPLEDELRSAMDVGARDMWDELRPRGTIDHVSASFELASKVNHNRLIVGMQKFDRPETEATHSLSITPISFPYRIEDVTGAVTFTDGSIQMRNIRGRHGRVKLSTGGKATVNDQGWVLSFEGLNVDQLQVDRDLLAAAPPRLAKALIGMDISGPASMVGNLELTADAAKAHEITTRWRLDVDLEGGSLGNGFELEHISGGIVLTGYADSKAFNCWGDLNVDSLTWRKMHLTNLRGPLWSDGYRVLLGAWTAVPSSQRPARHLTAGMFGGTVRGDAEIMINDAGDFKTNLELVNANVPTMMRDLGHKAEELNGFASCRLQLSGNLLGQHSWTGQGDFALRQTDLYELPFVLALMKTLRTGSTNPSAFNKADANFRLKGRHIYLDRIDLQGEALTLKGVGELNQYDAPETSPDVNINFYTVLGPPTDSRLAAIRPLLGMARGRFLLVKVRGKLDNPSMTREVLPGLNETLQQWFPETQLNPNGNLAQPNRPRPVKPAAWNAPVRR